MGRSSYGECPIPQALYAPFRSPNLPAAKGRIPCTPDNLRITVDEVRKRMEAGEDFVLIDTRNPQAWSQSDVKLPEAIRLPLDNYDENLSKIPKDKPVVAYCT
jgi:hypothetical protein